VQLHQRPVTGEFERLGASLVVVSFAEPEYLRNWVPWWRETFLKQGESASRTRFLADPARTAYARYGLGRYSSRSVYSPRILLQYARWAALGKPVRKTDEDKLQRGGDFVIGADGLIRMSHTGRDQSDRPPIPDILSALGSV
jgi:hypothetical protein